MKYIKNSFTGLMIVCIIFSFSIFNLGQLGKALGEELANPIWDSWHKATTVIQDSYKNKFFGKSSLIDLYGLVQLGLKKNMIGNFEYIKDNYGYIHMFEKNMDVNAFNSDLIKLNNKLNKNLTPFLYVQVPSREINNYTQLPAGIINSSNAIMDTVLNNLKNNQINYLDVRENLENGEYPKQNVFYKTDNHFTTETGIWIDELIIKVLKEKFNLSFSNEDRVFNLNNYKVITRAFLGGFSRSSGQYFVGLDKFNMYIPTFPTNYIYTNDVSGKKNTGSFESVLMNGYQNDPNANIDTYWITNYLKWPSPYYSIENELVKKNNILVIMDSNGLSAISYLSLLAHKVTIVDTRYLDNHDYLDQAIKSQKFDAVIMFQGTSLVEFAFFPKNN